VSAAVAAGAAVAGVHFESCRLFLQQNGEDLEINMLSLSYKDKTYQHQRLAVPGTYPAIREQIAAQYPAAVNSRASCLQKIKKS